jgi:O-antigen ligase
MTWDISRWIGCGAFVLIALSFLFTPNSPPLTSGFLEMLAVAGWGLVAVGAAMLPRLQGNTGLAGRPTLLMTHAVIFLPALFMAVDTIARPYEYPMLAFAGLLCILAAAVTAHAGFVAGSAVLGGDPRARWLVLCAISAIAAAAVLNALVGIVQYLQLAAPLWAVSLLTVMGRIYGNLRQPNQYALLLAWGCLAMLALLHFRVERSRVRKLEWPMWWIFAVLLALGVALSGSRAGGVFMWTIGLVTAFVPGLSGRVRLIGIALPIFHAICWYALVALDVAEVLPFFSTLRPGFNEGDVSNSRFAIWRDTWTLIQERPLTGYGFFRLNKELLTTDVVSTQLLTLINAHNIFIQWAFEFGIPAVILWSAAALLWLSKVWRVWLKPPLLWGGIGFGLAAAHNLLEHPWWFLHLLLPCAFVAGISAAFASPTMPAVRTEPSGRAASQPLAWCGIVMVLVSWHVWKDHGRLEPMYQKQAGLPPLAYRLESAYQTVWFRHFVDQAVVGSLRQPGRPQCELGKRVLNFYMGTYAALNTALACAKAGEVELARKLVAAVERGEPKFLRMAMEDVRPEDRAVLQSLGASSATSPAR